MSAKLYGKAQRYLIIPYAKATGVIASDRAIRAAKQLFLALVEHLNENTGQCNPSIKTLGIMIEKSHGATVASMNLLKTLGLVTVLKNAKGGRNTPFYALHFPRYEEFSRPVGKSASAPMQRTAENSRMNPSNSVEQPKPSTLKDASNPSHRTRILIEALDESLIKSLRDIKDKTKERDETIRLGEKYSIYMTSDMGVWQVQEALFQLIKNQEINQQIFRGR
jgi:hypothetical protein